MCRMGKAFVLVGGARRQLLGPVLPVLRGQQQNKENLLLVAKVDVVNPCQAALDVWPGSCLSSAASASSACVG
jgi:hypothetical protein